MKILSIFLSEKRFSGRKLNFIPPNCALHSVNVENSVCAVCGTFFKDRKSYRIEFYPEELLLETVDSVPTLCIYMSKPPMVGAEGDFVYETGSKILNFLTGNGLLELNNLNFILQEQVPGLFFRNNDCLVNLPLLLSSVPAGSLFERFCRWAFLQFLRTGFCLRLFPVGNAFKLELHFKP
jgi:hypothetical protein